jgi:hypothetical protein
MIHMAETKQSGSKEVKTSNEFREYARKQMFAFPHYIVPVTYAVLECIPFHTAMLAFCMIHTKSLARVYMDTTALCRFVSIFGDIEDFS